MANCGNIGGALIYCLLGGLAAPALAQSAVSLGPPLTASATSDAADNLPPDLEERLRAVEQLNKDLLKRLDALSNSQNASKPKSETQKKEDKGKEDQKGKSFEVGKDQKLQTTWKNGFWAETADQAFRFNVGGVIQFDMGFYRAETPLVRSIGIFNDYVEPARALSDGMNPRRARLRFSGTLWEQIEFFSQYDFAQTIDLRRRALGINTAAAVNSDIEPAEGVIFNEVYMGFIKLPIIGQVRVGRQRESLNFVTATSSSNQVWLERGLLFDAFNGDFNFANGVTVQNTWCDERVYGCIGMFQNSTRNRNFSVVVRLRWPGYLLAAVGCGRGIVGAPWGGLQLSQPG